MQAEPLSAADGRARAWMGQGGAARADAPHASSRARRVERRLVGASVGAFGRRNASTACQRDGLVPRNCNALGSRTSPGGPPGQIGARPSPRAVAASNRGLERGWSAGWGRRLQRRRGRARGCKCATRAAKKLKYASTQCRRVRLSSLSYFAGRSYKYCKGARCVSLRDVDGLALERASRREANDLRGELRRRALVVGLYLSGMRRERSEKN